MQRDFQLQTIHGEQWADVLCSLNSRSFLWLSFEVQESLTKPALQVLQDFNFISPRWSVLLHAAYRSAAGELQSRTQRRRLLDLILI